MPILSRVAPLAAAAFLILAAGARSEPAPAVDAAYDAAAHARHLEAYGARRSAEGEGYDARTELLDAAGGPRFLNRLILEASPYLRQHAHNPVDWRPWGPEALAEAKETNKPIFLSVGYATCHWCHVMEAESFDTVEVATALNENFIPVKVDREERPDVDETYMLATTLIKGSGGWPNSVWMTPDGEPFFAETYLPKAEFMTALTALHETWAAQPEAARAAAAQLAGAMRAYAAHRDAAADVTVEVYAAAQAEISERYNPLYGGFGVTAQFPMEVFLHFLLDRWAREGDAEALEMATGTLDAVLAGAVHDHVGGGFHRYAVDPNWTVPHYEKMLYNQAEIVRALSAAWRATGRERYRRGAERALDYVLRDMRAPDGAFYAAEDADSVDPATGVKREGAFYLWRREALEAALGAEAAEELARVALSGGPPFEGGAPLRAEIENLDALAELDSAFDALRRARAERPRPLRDEKIIAGWNGLTIRALAQAADAFERPDYGVAAAEAAEAIWIRLWRDGRMSRFYTAEGDGPAQAPAALEDYVWMGLGFVALWDLTGEERYLERARLLAAAAANRFDDGDGRLKMSEIDGPLGPVYQQDDGAVAAGESSALELFALLARRERAYDFHPRAESLLAALSGGLVARPSERVEALRAAAVLLQGEAAPSRALSNGVLRATARRSDGRLSVRLAMHEDWHVNAHKPLADNLIPTVLAGETLESVEYPPAKELTLGFSRRPVAVLDGEVEISSELKPEAADGPIAVSLTLQACSNEVCLAPETATFRIGPPER